MEKIIKPSRSEIINHCENYIKSLKLEKENNSEEPWIDEHIRMEEAIVEILKKSPDKKRFEWSPLVLFKNLLKK